MKPRSPRLAARALILHDNRLLLVNAYPGGLSDLWCAPGGGCEAGQSLPENLAREVREETGLEVEEGALAWLGVVHRRSDTNRIDFFVRAGRFAGEPRIVEPDKCDRLEWHAPRLLPAETVPYVRAALEAGEPPWVLELGWRDGA